MVVAARLRWVRRRLMANADVRIVIGSAQHAARSKIKIPVGEAVQPSPLHQVMQSAVLSAMPARRGSATSGRPGSATF